MNNTMSDVDICVFYQQPLALLLAGESESPYHAMYPETGGYDLSWYQKALNAMTQLSMSGLMQLAEGRDCKSILSDLEVPFSDEEDRIVLGKKGSWSVVWLSHTFLPTRSGQNLVRIFSLKVDAAAVAPDFRDALSRIFGEHSVGFDVELPYRIQF